MELELALEQPLAVAAALAALLAEPGPSPDPWWQNGIDEALESLSLRSNDGPPAQDLRSGARVVEP